MIFLLEMAMAAMIGQAVPPVGATTPVLAGPPIDLAIVRGPKRLALAAAALAAGWRGLAKISVRIDADGSVMDCAALSREADGPAEAAACRLASTLRFRKPPRGAAGALTIGVRYGDAMAEIVRPGPETPAKPDLETSPIVPEDYPPAALRGWQEGRAVADVLVSAEGIASDCHLVVSSGSPDLDAATYRLALRTRFVPARDGFGDAVSGRTLFPVLWRIPRGAPPDGSITGGATPLTPAG